MSRRTSGYKGIVVGEVKVHADVPETIPPNPVSYGGVVKSRISSPIVVITGKLVDPREDTKSHV